MSNQVASFVRQSKPLYKMPGSDEGLLEALLTKEQLAKETMPEDGESKQGVSHGAKAHPFNMSAVLDFDTSNEHHSTCLNTKIAAHVGLGHMTEKQRLEKKMKVNPMMEIGEAEMAILTSDNDSSKVDETLNPLCRSTWQETLSDVAEDYWKLGNGYLEVVRNKAGRITGIHHIPACEVHIYLENSKYDYHYRIDGTDEFDGTSVRRFAAWDDREDFIKRATSVGRDRKGSWVDFDLPVRGGEEDADYYVSEVIHFRRPSSQSKWYGFPDWLSCVASIELVQMLMQHNFDFFLNRGVPEFMALFLGSQIDPSDWKKIEDALKGNIGMGNSFKTVIANLNVDPEFRVQIEKLAMDQNGEDIFGKMRENLALGIVSAHRVPPLLAGIQIPGKLGATNELPNALMAFQLLVIGPAQKLFQQILGMTLGSEEAGLGLTTDDFAFVTITEEIDVGQMDTVARMRQTPMQAANEGRNLQDGVEE